MKDFESPEHYRKFKVQPIEICKNMDFCLGNVVKYVLRAPYKGGVEDCKKALNYLEMELELISEGNGWIIDEPTIVVINKFLDLFDPVDEIGQMQVTFLNALLRFDVRPMRVKESIQLVMKALNRK